MDARTSERQWTDRPDAAVRRAIVESLIEAAPDGLVVIEASGLIVMVNLQTEELFGYTRDELLGAPVEVLLTEDLREAHTLHRAGYMRTPSTRVMGAGLDLYGQRKDGSRFPVDISLSTLRTAQGTLVIAFVRDVTERKRAERAVRAGEERLRSILETANDAFVAMDAEGVITEWNRHAVATFGWSREEAVGRPLLETIMPRRYRQERERELRRLLETGEGPMRNQRLEFEAMRRDGTEFPIELTISAVRVREELSFTAVVRDVTERRRSEERLAAETALLDLAHDAIIVRDLEGVIALWNCGAEETYGWTAEEAVGAIAHELLATESAVPEEAIQRSVRERGRWDGELTQRRRDGTKICVASRWALQRDDRGNPRGVLEINTDITERKRAEALLEVNRLELERSNLDLASFAYVASHDLQEPLRMVSSYVQLLADRYRGKLDADADDFIHFAVDGAQRMQALIASILEYSRVGTAELALATVDTNELVAETVSSLESAIREKHAEITVERLPVLIADRTQLGQIFQNLISNSLKFIAHGVTPRVRVSAAREADSWRFSVEDNGIGIDPRHAARIFVPFKRLHGHTEYPGAGLGLSMCKRAVERHGGRIWIDPAPTGGSVFVFTIPDRTEEPDAARG